MWYFIEKLCRFRIRNLRWLKAMLTIYTLMQILRLKVKKMIVIHHWKAEVMVNPKLKILTIFGKNTIKSHVIHNWKAKVMQNQKFEVMFNFENLYVQNKPVQCQFGNIRYNNINVFILNIEINVLYNVSLNSYHWNNSMSMFLESLNIDINVSDDVVINIQPLKTQWF